MNVFTQHVAGGPGDIGHDRRFAACEGVQQTRFPGVWTTGDNYLHPFAQQATLARFGAHGVEIGHHAVELRFDFAIREEVDLFIREVDSCFDVDAQVSECFHKMIHARGKCTLQ
ncbi:hypothetical protein D3C87_1869910 [compost metagenome]